MAKVHPWLRLHVHTRGPYLPYSVLFSLLYFEYMLVEAPFAAYILCLPPLLLAPRFPLWRRAPGIHTTFIHPFLTRRVFSRLELGMRTRSSDLMGRLRRSKEKARPFPLPLPAALPPNTLLSPSFTPLSSLNEIFIEFTDEVSRYQATCPSPVAPRWFFAAFRDHNISFNPYLFNF